MQKLIMPFKSQMMLCGYKNAKYRANWGYDHYGADISTYQGNAGSDHNVYASGSGTVALCGLDSRVGNVVVVTYPDAYNHKTGKVQSLAARYMHLASVAVKAGQSVVIGTVLGVEGNTGAAQYDLHLHLEFDTDTQYPDYSPQVSGGTLIKKGTDSTVNPSFVLHVGAGQALVKPTYNPAWLNPEDITIPVLAASEADWRALYDKERDKRVYLAKLLRQALEVAEE